MEIVKNVYVFEKHHCFRQFFWVNNAQSWLRYTEMVWFFWKMNKLFLKYTEKTDIWCPSDSVCCQFNLRLSADPEFCSSRCSTMRKSWWSVPGLRLTSSARPLGLSWPVSTTMRSRCLLSSSSVPCLKGWYSPLGLVSAGMLCELTNASVGEFCFEVLCAQRSEYTI